MDKPTSNEKKLITPSGEELSLERETARKKKRKQENLEYVPVIVKRTDESFRHPDDILEMAIKEGVEQSKRPLISLALSAFAAGMILCFTVMAVAVVSQMVAHNDANSGGRIWVAMVYPLGFVLCILSRTQLFTEHTATAVYPLLDHRSSLQQLFRLWGIVIAGNLLGGFTSASMLVGADEVINAAEGYVILAHHLVSYSKATLLLSAIMAGWLMALGAWIVLSSYSTISQIVSIYMVTFLIGVGGLHHSIAGSIEMFTGFLISDDFTLAQVLGFIATALLGNLIGGSLFVAVLNYGHIRHSQRNE